MERLEDSFRRIFGDRGGAFDPNDVPDDLRFLFENPVEYVQSGLESAKTASGEPYPHYIGFIENVSFNAAASDTTAGGLICFHSEAPLMHLEACLRFAAVCDPGSRVPHLQERNLSEGWFGQKFDIFGRGEPRTLSAKLDHLYAGIEELLRMTDGDDLLIWAFQLYEVGALFIGMHECMHLVLGHAGYYQNALGERSMVEFSPQRRQLPSDVSHVLEFLADKNAAGGLWHVVARDMPKRTSGDERVDAACQTVLQAVCIVLHLVPTAFHRKDPYGLKNSHPHPYVRMQWINSFISSKLDAGRIEESLLRPFAHSVVAMSDMLDGYGAWLEVNRRNAERGTLASDELLSLVVTKAEEVQEAMWPFAPVYEGFAKGWPERGCAHRAEFLLVSDETSGNELA